MNKLRSSDTVEPILARATVSISGLKRDPAAVIAAARVQQVAILSRNRPVAYVISPEAWEHFCDVFEDQADAASVRKRLAGQHDAVEVKLEPPSPEHASALR